MDTFIVFAVVGTVLSLTGSAAALRLMGGSRARRSLLDLAWDRAATDEGLEFTDETIRGELRGQPVAAWKEVRERSGTTTFLTVVAAPLRRALDAGLGVVGRALPVETRPFFPKPPAPSFEEDFTVGGDEPARVSALLSPPLRRSLLEVVGRGAAVSLSDAEVRIEWNRIVHGHGPLPFALARAADLARSVAEQASTVEPASALAEHLPLWESFARAEGLTVATTPLAISGSIEGIEIEARAVRTAASTYALDVLASYPRPLGIGLLGRTDDAPWPEGEPARRRKVRTGDPALDAAVRVRATAPDEARRALDERARKQIVELRGSGLAIAVHDDRVLLRSPSFPAKPADAIALARSAIALARSLHESAISSTTASSGPYR